MQADITEPTLTDGGLAASLVLPLAALAVGGFVWAAAMIANRLRQGRPIVVERPQEPVPWNGIDVLQIMLIHVTTAVVGAAGLAKDSPLGKQIAVNVLAILVGTSFSMAYLVARGATLRDLGLVPGRFRDDLRLAVGGLALVVAPLLAMAALLNRLVPYEHKLVDFIQAHRDPAAIALVVLSAVVVAPVAEELFFRRVIQGWLEARLPEKDGAHAIGLAAAAFSRAHQGQGLAFLPLFPLALVLGYLARRTGSIVPSILLHALFNAVSVILLLLQAAQPARAG